jgi:hypothetical protein
MVSTTYDNVPQLSSQNQRVGGSSPSRRTKCRSQTCGVAVFLPGRPPLTFYSRCWLEPRLAEFPQSVLHASAIRASAALRPMWTSRVMEGPACPSGSAITHAARRASSSIVAVVFLEEVREALGSHLENVLLVGAQAVYHHTCATTLNVPVMTTDADLALDTRLLSDEPEIGASLRNAGFAPGANPGHWIGSGDMAMDLMVVPYQANTQKQSARSARTPPHEAKTRANHPGP